MKLFIKNMVCHRCKLTVQDILERQGLHILHMELGEIEIRENNIDHKLPVIKKELEAVGFELLDDKKSKIIEQIKNTIRELIQNNVKQETQMNFSDYLRQKLHKDYTYLSNLFSELEGITIEKYIIAQKIEKVKELLVYNELSLSEIAFKVGYSDAAHLSNQFKKATGLTPSHFKELGENKRKAIDKV